MRQLFVICLTLLMTTTAFAADVLVKVYVDGKLQSYDPAARLRGGAVYVPLRQGAESLGAQCKWQPETSIAQICSDSGCTLIRKREGIIVDGRLFLPLRRMGEALGATVSWDAEGQAVHIRRS
jgi:hypothetical protein